MKNTDNNWIENGERAYKAKLYNKAMFWFLKAAEQGDGDALKRLGDMYFYGHGVEQHYGKALDYYQAAEAHGNSEANYLYHRVLHVINLSI